MIHESSVVDEKGRIIAVQIPVKTYKKLLADSEELDDIKKHRKAKLHKRNAIPFDQVFKEIEDYL